MKKMTTKNQNKKSTEEKILQEATRLIEEYSYPEFSMQKLALAAGVTKSLIFYHFRNKKNLFNRIINDLFSGILESMEIVTEKNLPTEKEMELLILTYCQIMEGKTSLIKLWFSATKSQSKAISVLFSPYRNQLVAIFAQVVKKESIIKGASEIDPKKIAHTLVSMIDGWLYQKTQDGNVTVSRKNLAKILVESLKVSLLTNPQN